MNISLFLCFVFPEVLSCLFVVIVFFVAVTVYLRSRANEL